MLIGEVIATGNYLTDLALVQIAMITTSLKSLLVNTIKGFAVLVAIFALGTWLLTPASSPRTVRGEEGMR